MLSGNKVSNASIIEAKIIPVGSLEKQVNIWKFQGKKIVFTNGCFDIIHRGHIDYLAKAADLGDHLIIGLNTDSSVKRQNKGANRPLQDEKSRAIILASLNFVSAVILFDEDTPIDLINTLTPSTLVKGADYDVNETDSTAKRFIVGSDIVKKYGGEVQTIEFLEGYSTTSIENKIKTSV